MKKIFLIILILNCSFIFTNNWKQVLKDKGSAVCLIEITDGKKIKSSGSGFLISKDGYILTNAHVVKSAKYNQDLKIKIKFLFSDNSNKEYVAAVARFSKSLDLSVLKIAGNFEKFCSLSLSSELQIMDDIMVVGYPLGKNIKATPGVLQAFQTFDDFGQMLDISVDVDPGNSGGPVFNSNGEVVGVVTAELRGLNFNLAIPAELVNKYITMSETEKIVHIQTMPPSARIYVNGLFKGVSPLDIEFYGIKAEIKAEKDQYITEVMELNEKPEDGILELKLDSKVEQKRTLKIESEPSEAVVLIDNREVGKTPLTIEVDDSSKLRVRLVKKWYKEFYTEIIISDEMKSQYLFKLKK